MFSIKHTRVKVLSVLFISVLNCSCSSSSVAYQRTCELRLSFLPDQVALSDAQRVQLRNLALTASVEKFHLKAVKNETSFPSDERGKALLKHIAEEIFSNGVLNENISGEHYFDQSGPPDIIFITCKERI